MKESEYLEIMQGIRPEQITEAIQWQYRKKAAPEKNKQALSPAPRSLDEFFAPPEVNAKPEISARPRRYLSARGTGIAFGAVAAALVLVIGVILKNTSVRIPVDTGYSDPVSSGVFPDITAIGGETTTQTETATTALTGENTAVSSTDIPPETTAQATTATEITATRPVVTAPPTGYPDTTPNMLGGEGSLTAAIVCDNVLNQISMNQVSLFADNRYYYFLTNWNQSLIRIDKTTLQYERVCQVPNCTHTTQKCIEQQFAINNEWFSAGETLCRRVSDIGKRLTRLNADGTYTTFFNPDDFGEDFPDCEFVHYSQLLRLGNTGKYYLSGHGTEQTNSGSGIMTYSVLNFGLIFTPENNTIHLADSYSYGFEYYKGEQTENLPERKTYANNSNVVFDEARHTLFMVHSIPQEDDPNSFLTALGEYSIEDGGCFGISEPIDGFDGTGWTVQDGILYYLEHTENGNNYCRMNLDTREKTVLAKNCGWDEIMFTGDTVSGITLYALQSTGDKEPHTVLSYANPDGTGLAEYWQGDGRYTFIGANGGLVMLGKKNVIYYDMRDETGTTVKTENEVVGTYFLLNGSESIELPE